MRYTALLLSFGLAACGAETDKNPKLPFAASDAKAEAPIEKNEANGIPTDDNKNPENETPVAGGNPETKPDAEAPAGSENPPETKPTFAVDPETLSFPVVFHLGGSGLWQSEESLIPVIAEVQRILAQAKLEILPQYTQDQGSTDFMDVTYVPSVPDNPGVNGISFGGADLEVFVKDKVGLGRVADDRPAEAPMVRTLKDAVPSANLPVNAAQAAQARTTAHEIGHQLGSPSSPGFHQSDGERDHGLDSNAQEIETMRRTAARRFGGKFVAELPAE